MDKNSHAYTSFAGHRLLATGPLLACALAVRRALEDSPEGRVLVFDDTTGQVVDVDTRGSDADIATRLSAQTQLVGAPPAEHLASNAAEPRGRGRPRLGVVPREVTLLPRHWEWLAAQPGGASVALRKLVEEARRMSAVKDQQRQAQERAYRFMTAAAGDLPGFEEATRALFAGDRFRLQEITADWPPDVQAYALRLAACDGELTP